MTNDRGPDYWKVAASMVGSEQYRLAKSGMPETDARKQAYINTAEAMGDITPSDLASGIGKWAGGFPRPPESPCDRNATLFQLPSNNRDVPTGLVMAPDGPSGLLLEWIRDNDIVPSDNTLAHFTGRTSAAFAYARNTVAKREGYELEQVSHGCWQVVSRPKRRPTLEDIDKMVEERASDLLKQIKDELLTTFGYN